MKYILLVLLLIGISYGGDFGWTSRPTPVWLQDGYGATGKLDMDLDTLRLDGLFSFNGSNGFLKMNGDTLTFALTGASADRDILINLEEEDGTKHLIKWDDGASLWRVGGTMTISSRLAVMNEKINFWASGSKGYFYTSTLLTELLIDANASGAGTSIFGETGDNDIILFNSQQRVTICTVDSTHTMGSDGTSFYTVTSASDSLLCPSSPTDGDLFQCKFTDSGGGTIDGNGNNIDGSASFAASEDDNYIVIYNADSGEWEIR